MPRFIFASLLAILLISCDAGDLVVTTFDFDDQPIGVCTDANDVVTTNTNYVFYKINDDTQEALAFGITTNDSILTRLSGDTPYEYDFGSGDNRIVYRMFDAEVDGSYFCNNVPPASPLVTEEYISFDGRVEIVTQGEYVDNDGIPSEDELTLFDILSNEDKTDFDGDGIPNIYDEDDDGDNVPTNQEGVVIVDGSLDLEASLDTDEDGIPDFLDEDDDGDGVLTRNEDDSEELNPRLTVTDESAGPDFLNDEIAVDYTVDAYRQNNYVVRNRVLTINIYNLVFENQNGEDTIRQDVLFFGEFNVSGSQNLSITPDFPEE